MVINRGDLVQGFSFTSGRSIRGVAVRDYEDSNNHRLVRIVPEQERRMGITWVISTVGIKNLSKEEEVC